MSLKIKRRAECKSRLDLNDYVPHHYFWQTLGRREI